VAAADGRGDTAGVDGAPILVNGQNRRLCRMTADTHQTLTRSLRFHNVAK
jgi:hypothetical protein